MFSHNWTQAINCLSVYMCNHALTISTRKFCRIKACTERPFELEEGKAKIVGGKYLQNTVKHRCVDNLSNCDPNISM